jgi:zinc protease
VIRLAIAAAMSLALVSNPTASRAANVERVTTPLGLEIWFVRDDTLSMLSVEYAFRGGAAQDPAARPGVANMVAGLLDEGAGPLDARAFHERLEARAITLHFSADRDTMRGSIRTLSEHRAEAFELARLALAAPRFDTEAVERIRAALLAGLRRRATSPNDIASRRWSELAFPGHPYGRAVEGTIESVPQIAAEDLRAFARRNFARSNLKIAAVGSIDAKDLAALVDKLFGGLPEKAELAAVADATPQTGVREVVELNVPQTVILFGGAGLKRADPDFIPAYVLNHILGGGTFTSRLYREVREKRGLAYSISSYLAPYDYAGLFLGSVSTRNDRAQQSLDIIVEEIRRIAAEGPTADELAKAKSFLIGSYALRFDTSGKIAGQLLSLQLENLGVDYLDKRKALIEGVTDADIRRAAKRFLADARLLVLMVGRPTGVTSGVNGG